jgi:3',5'-cyclic AMP phosphodiesterase CpdA
MSSMFVLAHLSDPHLGPLPPPQWRELLGKRATGFINWRRKRHLIHRGDVLARIVADLKAQAPDHIAVTGDLVNLALPGEYAPARAWLATLGSPADVTLVPGNHDAYVRSGIAASLAHWGDFMRGDEAAGFPFLNIGRMGAPFIYTRSLVLIWTMPYYALVVLFHFPVSEFNGGRVRKGRTFRLCRRLYCWFFSM